MPEASTQTLLIRHLDTPHRHRVHRVNLWCEFTRVGTIALTIGPFAKVITQQAAGLKVR
jgi:hypothetical protein